jgi:pimeloyl-ACP methyl ester carboxylesterase
VTDQTVIVGHSQGGFSAMATLAMITDYHLGATNSNVALVSMLIVAGSGLVGRYLYSRIHYGVYGRKATLAELRAEAEQLKADASGAGRLLPEFAARLDAAEQRVASGVPLVPKALSAVILCRVGRSSLHRYVHRTLRAAAAASPAIAGHRRSFALAADRYADSRLTAARRLAEFENCQQLFSLWHVLHIPLFFMLLIAGVVHVIAVNIY